MSNPIHIAGFEVPVPNMDNPEMRKKVEAYTGLTWDGQRLIEMNEDDNERFFKQ